jgi:UDPglucose 6-dehydrogenase
MNIELKVAFFGLSHLGIVSLISLASKHVHCIGVDLDAQLVSELARQKWPIQEPEIDEVYNVGKSFITFSSDPTSLRECDIVYISQDVPTDDFGKSNLGGVEALIDLAAKNLSKEARIVVLCQVPPGFTRRMKKYHLNISYQVETLVFGQAFGRALKPERIIVGVESPTASLDPNYVHILEQFACPVLLMDYESAEFTKISINALLAATVTTTNALNEIAKSVGANWDSVQKALRLDRRIGPYAYLKPGLGISGGNIERDLQTLNELEQNPPGESNLFRTYLENSQRQKRWIFDSIKENILDINSESRIGILGIAYKENTDSIKNSVALEVIDSFTDNIIGVYDPIATLPSTFKFIKQFESAEDCIRDADAVVVMTPWEQFSHFNFPQLFGEHAKPLVVIDPYGILNLDSLPPEITVIDLTRR